MAEIATNFFYLRRVKKILSSPSNEVISFNYNDNQNLMVVLKVNSKRLEELSFSSAQYLDIYKMLKKNNFLKTPTWEKLRDSLKERLSVSNSNQDKLGSIVD